MTDDREVGIAALAELLCDDPDRCYDRGVHVLQARAVLGRVAAHPDLAHKVRDAIPAEPPSYPSPGESAGFDALVDSLRAEYDQGHFMPWDEIIARIADAIPAEPLDVRGLGPNPFGLEDEDPAAAIAEAALREWWDDLTSEEQWEAFRIEKDNSDSMDSLADPASHIGCRFNHVHRWPDCYDEAYEPDTLDRLMALWQQPWSEAAFGEAQMLVGRLRRKPLNVERLARTGVKVWGWDLHRARQYAKDFAREYAALPDTILPENDHE